MPIFSKVNGKASLTVLAPYSSPVALLAARTDALAEVIQKAAGKGEAMAQEMAVKLLVAAQKALSFGYGNSGITFLIGHYMEMIHILDEQTAAVLKQIRAVGKKAFSNQRKKTNPHNQRAAHKKGLGGQQK